MGQRIAIGVDEAFASATESTKREIDAPRDTSGGDAVPLAGAGSATLAVGDGCG